MQTLYEKVRAVVRTQGLKPRLGEEYSLMLSYVFAVALGARLGHPETEGLSDSAPVIAEQSFSNAPDGGREGQLDQVRTMLVDLAAQGSASLTERISSELPAGARLLWPVTRCGAAGVSRLGWSAAFAGTYCII